MIETDPPLAMTWPSKRLAEPQAPPAGYVTKALVDKEEFIRVQAGIGWSMRSGQWEDLMGELVPGGMMFCENMASKESVAVACAMRKSAASVELGWVAVIPAHRGKALAYALCATLIAHVFASGFTQVNLTTQDQRLGALKTYLQLGFKPVLEPPTLKRWQRVFDILDWPFRAEP